MTVPKKRPRDAEWAPFLWFWSPNDRNDRNDKNDRPQCGPRKKISISATSARGRRVVGSGGGITTAPKQIIIYFLFFRARLRLVILVILVISAIRAQETGSVGCFAAKNEDAKQYHLIPPKRVLFL